MIVTATSVTLPLAIWMPCDTLTGGSTVIIIKWYWFVIPIQTVSKPGFKHCGPAIATREIIK